MSASNTISLRDIVKTRIFDEMLLTVEGWKVVMTDKYSLKVLNACCRMDDIGDVKVSLVEDVMKPRQPYPNQNAVYFLTPLPASVDAVLKDFDRFGYKGAYIFFTTGIPDELFDKISKHKNCAKYVKQCTELYVDFTPFESQIFSFDRNSSFYHFYSPNSKELHLEVDFIANKIASVCAAVGEIPIIRFSAKSTAPDRLTARLASLLQNKIDLLVNKRAFNVQNDRPRLTLFILDRSFDVVAPLVHEFTYQAMANDLLPIKNGNQYTGVMGDGKTKEVILDERESIWAGVRHLHISDAIQVLVANFQKFIQENPAARNYKKATGGDSSTTATLKEMRETINSLPQFQELKGQFEAHINMSSECMKEFQAKNLEKIAEAEQNMATGFNADGSVVDCPITDIVSLLCDPDVSSYDKVRLIILYIICKEGVKEADRKALTTSAKLSIDDVAAISNISFLGVKLSQGSNKKKSGKKKKTKKRSDDVSYELSRFQPNLKYFLEDFIAGSLSTNDYPYIRESDQQDESDNSSGPGNSKKAVASLRGAYKPTWQSKSGGASSVKEGKGSSSSNQGRIMVFFAGGITLSEARTVYELSQSTGREIYVGGTNIISPTLFLDSLRDLRRAERLDLQTGSLQASSAPIETPPGISPVPRPSSGSRPGSGGKGDRRTNSAANGEKGKSSWMRFFS